MKHKNILLFGGSGSLGNEFVKKHIKTTANGYHYIPQYNDSWYGFTFDGKYDIVNFKTFMKVLTPYFSVQRITYS